VGKKNKNLITVVIIVTVLMFMMVFSSSKNTLVRQLQGPTEGTGSILTIDDRLVVISKNNAIYTWQWSDLSVWPVVARLQARVVTPITGDKIVYVPSGDLGELVMTDLKGQKEISRLNLSYGAECGKLKMSSKDKFGIVSIFFKEGTQKDWFKLAVFNPDLKDMSFVFQKDTNAEVFLLYDFTVTNDANLFAGAGKKDHAWVFITDVKNENILWEKTFPEYDQFTSLEFSPDGKTLFVSERVRHILVFDTITGRLVNKFVMDEYQTNTYQKQNICCIAISPDGRTLAADTEPARTVWFWDIETGKRIASIEASELTVSSIAFSPDSKYLATGCLVSPEIKIWKVPQLKP
jgi:WD40 repeat protein